MTTEEKWQSILDAKWPHNTVPADRKIMAKFIAILEETDGFDNGAYIKKEHGQIFVIFPSGARVTRCYHLDTFSPPTLLYWRNLGIMKPQERLEVPPSDEHIKNFLAQYWDKLFPKEEI